MIDAVYHAESRCILATLIRLLGGFELAEEPVHEAFAAAVERGACICSASIHLELPPGIT